MKHDLSARTRPSHDDDDNQSITHRQLHDQGQSLWLDNIPRAMLNDGNVRMTFARNELDLSNRPS